MSGIRESDMMDGKARSFEDVQKEVARLVEGKVLIGHAIAHDTKVSGRSHPHVVVSEQVVSLALQSSLARMLH